MRLFPATKLIVAALTVLVIAPLALIHSVSAQEVSSATTIPDKEDPATIEIKKQLQKNYDEMAAGFARFDVTESTKYYTTDYKSIGKGGGKTTRQEVRDIYKKFLAHALRSEMKNEITLCTVKGDTATVQTHLYLRSWLQDDYGDRGLMTGDEMARDFWVKRKGAWQLKQSRSFDFNVQVDGQTIAE